MLISANTSVYRLIVAKTPPDPLSYLRSMSISIQKFVATYNDLLRISPAALLDGDLNPQIKNRGFHKGSSE